jgi:hypothetical protein
MKNTKAQQTGVLVTFISAAMVSGLILCFIGTNKFMIFDFTPFGEEITPFFLVLYIPILIVFSIIWGKELGERNFIQRDKDMVYYTAQTVLNAVGVPFVLTLGLRRVYFLFIELVEAGKMNGAGDLITYLFYLLGDLMQIAFSGIFIYAALIIPCAIISLFSGLILIQLRK